MDPSSIEQRMSGSILNIVTQQEANRLQAEQAFFDPDVLERRIAQRIANMSEAEFRTLREQSSGERLSRRIGRASERFRKS